MSVLHEDSGYVRVHWGGQGRRRRTGTVIYIGVDRIIHSRDQNYTHNIFWDNISWEISEYVKSTTGHNLYFLSWCKIKSVGCWTILYCWSQITVCFRPGTLRMSCTAGATSAGRSTQRSTRTWEGESLSVTTGNKMRGKANFNSNIWLISRVKRLLNRIRSHVRPS